MIICPTSLLVCFKIDGNYFFCAKMQRRLKRKREEHSMRAARTSTEDIFAKKSTKDIGFTTHGGEERFQLMCVQPAVTLHWIEGKANTRAWLLFLHLWAYEIKNRHLLKIWKTKNDLSMVFFIGHEMQSWIRKISRKNFPLGKGIFKIKFKSTICTICVDSK